MKPILLSKISASRVSNLAVGSGDQQDNISINEMFGVSYRFNVLSTI